LLPPTIVTAMSDYPPASLVVVCFLGAFMTYWNEGSRSEAFFRNSTRLQLESQASAQAKAEALKDSERLSALKSQFLATISHELRTPLNGILGMTQIMLTDSTMAPSMRSQIELVHDAGSTMRLLVDDILDVAKIEHGGFTINPRPADVPAMIERVAGLFAEQARKEGLHLVTRIELPREQALIDAERLTQILFNLVGNAIKFTHEGGIEIGASLSADVQGQPRLLLSVKDSGIGIDPQFHDSVFEMFHQVDGTRTRSYGGTGLGLAICRQLARAMGGDIRLESQLGHGARFIVDLPWEGRPVAELIPATQPVETAAGVAIVAKDPMRAAMLSAIARRAGATVRTVDTEEALTATAHDRAVTLLVDGAATEFALGLIAGVEGVGGRTIIAGGEVADNALDRYGLRAALTVPFSRTAIESALGTVASMRPLEIDSGLQSLAGQPIAEADKGVEKQDLDPAVGMK
jgi:signal transduction histidine kinase